MATNLPGNVCLGEHSVCLLRVAQLDSDCSPVGGADSGFATTGILTATADAVTRDAVRFAPTNGCGNTAWQFNKPARVEAYDISGELNYFSPEIMEILFGGGLITGAAGSAFAGKTIGWYAPHPDDPDPASVHVEFITRATAAGVGECSSAGAEVPTYVVHVYPKARFTPGSRTFEFSEASMAFTARAEPNPNGFNGPWNDYPGVGYAPNSPYYYYYVSEDEFDAMATGASCGYVTLPVAS